MSNTAIKTVSFSGRVDEDSVWVKMEQKKISETSMNANLFDIFQMMNRSASGLSAHTYTPTSLSYVGFTSTSIVIKLDFWLFPSDLDLPYTLKINQGSLSPRSYEEVSKMGNIVIPLSDSVQMPYLIDEEQSSFYWETPVYDTKGNLLDDAPITVTGPYLTFEKDVFGIIRADIKAKGYKYTATISFPKTQEGRKELFGIIQNQTTYNSISNVKCTVICTYIDEDNKEQEEILELAIPKNVEDFLAECPDGTLVIAPRECTDDKDNVKTYTTTIYYSTCTGEILDRVRSDIGANGCDND